MKDTAAIRASVVVPAYNEESTIEALLVALSRQTLLPCEVIIVDAGSNDRTTERIESFRAPFVLRLLRKGRLNPGQARNEGVRQSHHRWIALVDAGSQPKSAWLEKLMERVHEEQPDVVFGSYTPACDTIFRKCAAIAYVPPRETHGIRGPASVSMAIQREAFERSKGFPPYRASEDLIFIENLLKGSYKIAYAPDAEVVWETAPTSISTFKRFHHYSKANLIAGRARYWHIGLVRGYLAVSLVALLLKVVGGSSWLWALLPAWFFARSLKAGLKKRNSLPFETLNPVYLVGASFILALLDIATWTGFLNWLIERHWEKSQEVFS